ncbi:cytochrome c maturation protein CcmE [Ectothiorhodospira mobilis]|uniref:cytochrome c maturation protein CcmE n=1 Tax=Ectothiorhodospira mobilis TaxID=195064 RepID=UPI001EE7BB17|nr:cytochrome c maturation protein CcmE [Ectothiorhodospira mobilis]MCG5534832.1 cytochrome c maturation protein CcmE [Ectothiorhodospira mobilis]
MRPRQKRRLAGAALVVLVVAGALTLVLNAFSENLMYFYAPSDLAAGEAPDGRIIRLGGLVEQGSVEHAAEGIRVRFRVTDTAHSVPVVYEGLLPDLFREGQGVVTHGRLGNDGVFRAQRVLARHDEDYMSPEVAEALESAGQGRPGSAQAY